jgi:hemerythrin superfamily protein
LRAITRQAPGRYSSHAKSEEKTFYEALKATEDKQLSDEVPHFVKEHKEVEKLFEEIGALEAAEPQWWEKFAAIRKALLHHMDEEEKEVFPEAKHEIDAEDANALGENMEALEERVKMHLSAKAA